MKERTMRSWRVILASLSVVGAAVPAHAQDDAAALSRATASVRAGRYEEGLAALAGIAARSTAPSARRLQVRTLLEVGRDAEAETLALRYATDAAAGDALQGTLGHVLAHRGAVREARAAFERALAARASDSLEVRGALAALLDEAGDRAAARAHWMRVASAADGARLSAPQLVAVGEAQHRLARTEPTRVRQALRAFDAAVAADATDPEPRRRAGALFLEKFNAPEARASFEAVLRANPRDPHALLGMARVRQFDGAPGAAALADSALKTNPRAVEAHLLLAGTYLEAEDYARADSAVRRALAVDSSGPDALTMLAAVRRLRGDDAGFEAARRRVLARAPRHATLYVTIADLAAKQRQYAAAARLAAEGVALDSTSWRSHALRGINLLRLGHSDSARTSLERAFAGDPFDVWTKNTLDLLDATRGYRTTRTPRFTLVADSAESTLLSLYLGELLEDGYDRMAARYGYRPPPIRLELYRRHADFSVRTVGLAGLGALGVSFGPVLAMDAPSAREAGEFHWGATAWHELAHTFTLGVTDNRVPRWVSEGLSVLEERRARPGWGDGPTPAFLSAWREGRVPPPSRLNDGFVRPVFPQQVILSYYAASLVCEMIERDFGAAAIPAMLTAYRQGLGTEAAIARALRIDLPTLDRRFDTYVRARFGRAMEAVAGPTGGQYGRLLAAGDSAARAGRNDVAIAAFTGAKALFPEHAEGESPYWRLAQLYQQRGDRARAAAELRDLTARNGGHLPAQLALATLREQLGDTAGAAAALEQAIWIWPYDPQVHARLATHAERLGDTRRAVRERRAVVALAPVDLADARYQLARLLLASGDRAAAKAEVLRALEAAPTFAPAQELLLTLVDGPRAGGGAP
ncbi:MAG: tetratricopeptide repeat protein [Gemmatirosa sp.]